MDRSGYSYYDDLRKYNAANFTPIFTDENRVGRNLHRYTSTYRGDDTASNHTTGNSSSTEQTENDEKEDVILCHTPVFIRYTTKSDENYSDAGYGGAAAAMLAMHHWNNGNGVVVKSIDRINETCPIRFTTEIFDTRSNAVPAVRGLTDMMIRKPSSIAKPQPCAIVGTLYSSVSTKFAITSGVYDLLQVSPGASSDALDDQTQFPLFGRTHPADGGAALLLPKYLKEQLNVTNFAIVFVHTDGGFGTAYHKVVLKYAEEHGMNVKSIAITYLSDPERKTSKEQIKRELQPLVESKLNYILGVFFFSNFEPIMEAAVELGLAGPGRFWFFAGSLSDRIYEKSIEYEKGSKMAKAMYGNAIITDGGAAPGTDQYMSFQREWQKLGDDEEFLNYVNSKQPRPMIHNPSHHHDSHGDQNYRIHNFNRTREYFYREPIPHIAIYSYEAVISIGLAACEAAREAGSSYADNDVFSGSDHHNAFQEIHFMSASGNVTFGPTHPSSRNETSTFFVVANILETEESERNATGVNVILQGRNHKYFDPATGDWKTFGTTKDFLYSDGTIIRPPEILEAVENENLVTGGVRAYCLLESAVAMIASIAFLVYTIKSMKNRNTEIARSQPPFLIMICCGTLLMGSSLIPFSVDETVTRHRKLLNLGCSMFYWCFSLGFTITFAALYSKLRRATKLSEAGLRLRRIRISIKDVLKPFLILFFSNTAILTAWETIGNLRWERSNQLYNEFDQVISSEGSCVSYDMAWYFSSLIFVNGAALLLACYEAYRGRNSTDSALNESKYVGMAMICIFQSCFFGVPLIIISSSNKSSLLFVTSSICFVICIATLLFIFLPKILKQRERASTSAPNTIVTGLSDEAQRLRRTMRLTGTSLISQHSDFSDPGRGSTLSTRASTNIHMRSSNYSRDAFTFRESVPPSETRTRSSVFQSRESRNADPHAGSISSLVVLADDEPQGDDEGTHGVSDLSIDAALSKRSKGSRGSSRYSHATITSISEIEESMDVDKPIDTPIQRSSVSSLENRPSVAASMYGTVTEECTISGDEGDEELKPFFSQRTIETATPSPPSASAHPIEADDDHEDMEEAGMLEPSDSFKHLVENVENLARRDTNLVADGDALQHNTDSCDEDDIKSEDLHLNHHHDNVEDDIEDHEDNSKEPNKEADEDGKMHQIV